MKKINWEKEICLLAVIALVSGVAGGCGQKAENIKIGGNASADNVIITETGEVVEKQTPTPEVTSMTEEHSTDTALEIVTVDPELLVEPSPSSVIEQTEPQLVHYDDSRLQIVFMGDSVFASNNGDGTSIPERTAMQCDANYYNLAIGGTTAAVLGDEQLGWEEWESIGLLGVVYAVTGNISTDVFNSYAVKTILDDPNVDFSKTDYFVIEYGTNDFLNAVPLAYDSWDTHARSYVGALGDAVSALKRYAPDATIVLCSPMYAQFFNGNWMIGDGNSVNNGYGTLFDYKGICEYVANEQQVLFFNAYQDLDITGYSADEYLEDGIHPTDAGRQIYAETLSRIILKYEETKNN